MAPIEMQETGLIERGESAYPTVACLDAATNYYRAVQWYEEVGLCGVRWTRFRVLEIKEF